MTALGHAPSWAADLVEQAGSFGEDVVELLALARDFGGRLPLPGDGDTLARWATMAELAGTNLTAARVLEAHTDALAILAEAGEPPATNLTWGVFAAEAPGARLDADVTPDGCATLTGTKPWCSLAADLDAALVTAHTPDGRRLFRVDLRAPGVTPEPAEVWAARGLRTVTSAPVHFAGSPATAVGPAGWYLTRPGFAWGGIGVAACWFGGAAALADAIAAVAARRGGELDRMHLGAADVALHGAATALREAAALVDGGAAGYRAGELLALRVRSVVADAAERVLRHAFHALGPAPLAFDADHAARVADLEVYVRQHHAERDLATLGELLTDRTGMQERRR